MKADSHLPEIRTLPTEKDYALSHSIVDDSFGKNGAWGNIAETQYDERRNNEAFRPHFINVLDLATVLLKNDTIESSLTGMRLASRRRSLGKAFTQGFFQQLEPSRLHYTSTYTYANAAAKLHYAYNKQTFEKRYELDSDELYEQRSKYLHALGEYGLDTIGPEACMYIDQWASQVYGFDSQLEHAFKIGHGAMAICARTYQEAYNLNVSKMPISRNELDSEIAKIFDSGH